LQNEDCHDGGLPPSALTTWDASRPNVNQLVPLLVFLIEGSVDQLIKPKAHGAGDNPHTLLLRATRRVFHHTPFVPSIRAASYRSLSGQ
jgi:hypothetical protein